LTIPRQTIAHSLLLLAIVMVPSGALGFTNQAYGATSPTTSFTFAAGGDIGTPNQGAAAVSLSYLAATNPDFFLALGDLSYDRSVTGGMWCNEFKEQYDHIEIIAGAHDTGEFPPNATDSTRSFEKFVNNCPFTSPNGARVQPSPLCPTVPIVVSCYGREYYFDYPSSAPIARFIMLSPGVFNITGGCRSPCVVPAPGITCNPLNQNRTGPGGYDCWPYAKGDPHYNWVNDTINDARNYYPSIRWTIVGMHKPCLSAGKENCSIGQDIFNLLLLQHVDLVLEGNDHAYERSKQLSLGNGSCSTTIPYIIGPGKNNSFVAYNPDCVVDDSSNGFYKPQVGTTLIIQGNMGRGNEVDDSSKNPYNANEQPYFARLMGNNTVGFGHGFVKFTVSASEIRVQTVFTGTAQDEFRITQPPVPFFSRSPINPSIAEAVTFRATVLGGLEPYSYSWDFGDGSALTGAIVQHVFSNPRQYTVTLTVDDSSMESRTVQKIVAVGSWNAVVNCSPVLTTIEEIIGPKGINRNSSDPNSIGADYTGGGFQLVPNLQYNPQSPANPTIWPFYKRAVNLPPDCAYGGIPAFVELHNVGVRTVGTSDCSYSFDVSNGGALYPNGWQSCVTAFNLENWNYTACPICYMHRVYGYVDRDWNASGDAPYPAPTRGERIDVQGFIYWEYSSLTTPWHSYSGWELLVTGWRVSQQNQTQPPNSPSTRAPGFSALVIYVGLAVSFAAAFVGTFVLGTLYEKRKARSGRQREESRPTPSLETVRPG